MNADEVRRLMRERILRRLFGEEYRADRPLESLGGEIGFLIDGYDNTPDKYMKRVGYIAAMKSILIDLDETIKQIYEPPQEHI